MYENGLQRDLLKAEMDYRLGRVRAGIVGRSRRRALTRRDAGTVRTR